MTGVFAVIRRDLLLTLRQGSDAALILVFYLLCVLLFPFAVGPDPAVLARIGPGVLWVTALLATLLALDRLFAQDFEDGSLDQLALLPLPLPLLVLSKVIA
ncbi:MAG TPA: heme exporter protein CcmB, partial [Dongiaceae bacterium]